MFKQPTRKKKRVKQSKPSPFPVPIQSITGINVSEKTWLYYTGYLHGTIIAVRHSGDMNYLYKMGFFGKGNLSRGEPVYNSQYKYTSILVDNRELYPRIVSKQWYKNHLSWAEGNDASCSSSEEEESDEDHDQFDPRINTNTNCDSLNVLGGNSNPDSVDKQDWAEKSIPTQVVDIWDNTEYKCDFWNDNPKDSWETSIADENFWNNTSPSPESSMDTSKKSESIKLETCSPNADSHLSENMSCDSSKLQSETLTKKHTYNIDIESIPKKKLKVENKVTEVCNDESTSNVGLYDSRSVDNSYNGDLFVIPEKSYEENKKLKSRQWKPVLKINPFPIKEYLQLSFVEAFFLSYGLGCLIIKEMETILDIPTMWKAFCSRQRNFLPSYICYHYFRSKGWIPKSGLKFGCDFILYKVGPPFYHGSYSVIIQYVEEGSLNPINGFPQRKLSWRSLCGLNRITEHVGKEVMLFYVIKPKHIKNDSEPFTNSYLSQFKVKEILLSRWISSQERQSQNKDISEDIP